MTDLITQLGVGGIFALLVIKEVFTHIEKRRSDSNPDGPKELGCILMNHSVEEIQRFHERLDKTLEVMTSTLSKIQEALAKQDRLLAILIDRIKRINGG